MALFPCDRGSHRYAGRQLTAYVGMLRTDDQSRYKLRLCPTHFGALQDHLAQFEVDPLDNTTSDGWLAGKCVSCFEPVDEGGWQVFVTSYPPNQERKDYWGKLHETCSVPPVLIEAVVATLIKKNARKR